MRKFLIAAFAVSGLALGGLNLKANEHEGEGWNGVLIDAACGAKQKTEEDAAAHPKSCAMKEACAKSGYGLFKDDMFIKFDAKGNDLAKKYLAEEDHGTMVHVEGELDEKSKTIHVTAIHAEEEAEKEGAEKSEK